MTAQRLRGQRACTPRYLGLLAVLLGATLFANAGPAQAFAIATAKPPDRIAFDELGLVVEVLQSGHAGNDLDAPAVYVYAAEDSRLLGRTVVGRGYDPLVFALPDSTVLFCGKSWHGPPNDSFLIAFNPVRGFSRGFVLESLPEISCARAEDLTDTAQVAPLQLGWFGNHHYGWVDFASDSVGRFVIVRTFCTSHTYNPDGQRVPLSDTCIEVLRIEPMTGRMEHDTELTGTPSGLKSVTGRRLPGYPSITGAAHVSTVRQAAIFLGCVGVGLIGLGSLKRFGPARFWLAVTGIGILWTFVDPSFTRDLDDLARGAVTTEFHGMAPKHSYIHPIFWSGRAIAESAAAWITGWLVAVWLIRKYSRNIPARTIAAGLILPFVARTAGLLIVSIPSYIAEADGFNLEDLIALPIAFLLVWLSDIGWLISRFYFVVPLGMATSLVLSTLLHQEPHERQR